METVVSRAAATSMDVAFATFYGCERDRLVRALAIVLRDPELAAEAVDEAMARAWARWSSVGDHANPAGWVYRVALNWARSRLRRRRFRSLAPVPDQPMVDPDPVDEVLWAAVDALPLAQRSAVVLRYGLDWPLQRIAEATGAPVGTVKSRVSRGVAALRSQLEVTA